MMNDVLPPRKLQTPLTTLAFLEADANILCAATRDLINWGVYLHEKTECVSVTRIYDDVNALLEQMMAQLDHHHIAQTTSRDVHFMICAFLDEMVLSSNWGLSCQWAQQGLVAHYYHSVNGGNLFFEKLDALLKKPDINQQILELAYLLLACGYLGKYRVSGSTDAELASYRQRLYHLIAQQRTPEQPLALPLQEPLTHKGRPPQKAAAGGVIVCCVLLLFALYTGLFLSLQEDALPLIRDMQLPTTEPVSQSPPVYETIHPGVRVPHPCPEDQRAGAHSTCAG